MDLTPENKAAIDAHTHHTLLQMWRNAPTGNPWFQGETGRYWSERMAELRAQDPAGAVRDSKSIGFDR